MKKIVLFVLFTAFVTSIFGCPASGEYGALGFRSKSDNLTRKWTYSGVHTVPSGDAFIYSAQGSRPEKPFEITPYPVYEKHAALVKISADNTILWHKTYKDINNHKIYKDNDGAIYSFGEYENDLTILKHDANGNLLWAKQYDISVWDGPLCLFESEDGFMIASNTSNTTSVALPGTPFLLAVGRNGEVKWGKYYPGLDNEKLSSCKKDGNGFILSTSQSHLIKINGLGNIIWAKQLTVAEGADGYIPTANTVVHPDSNGYLFSGERDNDLWVVFMSKQGKLVWEHKYDAQYGIHTQEMLSMENGDIALIANTISFRKGNEPNTNRIWIAPMNPLNGALTWQKVFDLPGNDSVHSAYLSDKGFVITGTYNDLALNQSTNALLINIDINGNFPEYSGKYKVRETSVVPSDIESVIVDMTDTVNAHDFTCTGEDIDVEQKTAESVISFY